MRRGRANEKLILEITGQRAAVEGMVSREQKVA